MKDCNVKKWKITSITPLQDYHEMEDARVPQDQRGRIAGHAKGNHTDPAASAQK